MSTTTKVLPWVFRPWFASSETSADKVQKRYKDLSAKAETKPNWIKSTTPATSVGIGAAILGFLGFLGSGESGAGKFIAGLLTIAGLALAGVGKFMYGVDLSATPAPTGIQVPPVIAPKPPAQEQAEPAADAAKPPAQPGEQTPAASDATTTVSPNPPAGNGNAPVVDPGNNGQDTSNPTGLTVHLEDGSAGETPEEKLQKALDNLKDAEPLVVASAIDTLGKIGTKESIEAITPYLQDERFMVRGSVVESLRKSKSPDSVQPLIDCLKDKTQKPHVRFNAAVALASNKIGDKLIPILQEIITDEEGDTHLVPKLQQLLDELQSLKEKPPAA